MISDEAGLMLYSRANTLWEMNTRWISNLILPKKPAAENAARSGVRPAHASSKLPACSKAAPTAEESAPSGSSAVITSFGAVTPVTPSTS